MNFKRCQCKNGRGERIRTSDPLVPNQVRYQTALRPEMTLKLADLDGAYLRLQALGHAGGLANSTL